MKRIFILIVLIFNVFVLIAAPSVYDSKSFSMYFEKPPVDIFYFIDPNYTGNYLEKAPDEYYPTAQGGVQFELPSTDSGQGYKSRGYIGIYYNFESQGVLKVYFNSSSDLNKLDTYRLRPKDKDQTGLNYKIAVGTSKSAADTSLTSVMKDNTFDGTSIEGLDATSTVFTVNSHQTGTSSANVIYGNVGVAFFAMEIRSGKDPDTKDYVSYSKGQYTGYVTMQYTTI